MNIIYINKGNNYYLKSVLTTTAKYNKDVVLIGDQKLKKYQKNNISFELINEYREKFGYKHISINHPDYEEFCIERWFILKNYMLKNNVEEVWYSDSDNIIYDDITKLYTGSYDCLYLQKQDHVNPHLIYLNQRAVVALCDFFKNFYSNINKRKIDRVKTVIKNKDHISDMYLIYNFIKSGKIKSNNFVSDFTHLYDMLSVVFIKGVPYLNRNKLINVHFYGFNKIMIPLNLYANIRKYEYLVLNYLNNYIFIYVNRFIGKIGYYLKSKKSEYI